MSNGEKQIKQFNLIKNISSTKENISKYLIDYHLKNENLLSNSLIKKRLSKHSSYRKNNKSII